MAWLESQPFKPIQTRTAIPFPATPMPVSPCEGPGGGAYSALPRPLRERPRSRHPFGVATAHQLGVVRASRWSILSSGCHLEWDPAAGPPAACVFRKAELALAEPEFVSAAIKEDVRLGTLAPCSREWLGCSLALGPHFGTGGHVHSHLQTRHSVAAGGSGPYYWRILARAQYARARHVRRRICAVRPEGGLIPS